MEELVCLVLDLVDYLVEVLGLVDNLEAELEGYLEVDLVDYLVEELVGCPVELVVFLAVVLEDSLALELDMQRQKLVNMVYLVEVLV